VCETEEKNKNKQDERREIDGEGSIKVSEREEADKNEKDERRE
jgi:hypothetical protein